MRFFTLTLVFLCLPIYGQNDTSPVFTGSVYGDFYFSTDIANPNAQEKPVYLYNHKRNNELNLNLLLIKGSYQNRKLRANVGLMAGNYAQYNMSSEPAWAQNIYEANIGFELSAKQNIWIDAGIFSSHYGFESLLQTESWTLTRGMYVENVPYYISGIAVSKLNKKKTVYLGAILTNGWQHIQRPSGYKKPSIGLQIKYEPNSRWTINYCNFLGSDRPDSANSTRTFHNFYIQYTNNDRYGFVAEYNIGTDKYNSSDYASWMSAVCIFRHRVYNKFHFSYRTEYFFDDKNIIIPDKSYNGFEALGISFNADYQIQKNLLFRIEAKDIRNYRAAGNSDWEQAYITTTLAFTFSK